jgi:Fic family protein
MLDGIEQTSLDTIELIKDISTMMDNTKKIIQEKLPKIYSKDLVEILFNHPYTKIDFLVDVLRLHRETASKYLKQLETLGIVESIKIKNSKFYINVELFARLKKGI